MKSIAGYDEYEQDFPAPSLPEYCWMAGQLLIEALEDYQPAGPFHVYMPGMFVEGSCPAILFLSKPVDNKRTLPALHGLFLISPEKGLFAMKPFRFPWKTYPPHG